ncbi:MAG: hypothetical protein K6C10_04875 [Prevotella sp.]|nr:hypothetical protein [Prevotella sp.]
MIGILMAFGMVLPSFGQLTVTTDSRFVRGATLAFGRMTVSGVSSSDIAEQGFCYSTETNEPTVNDLTATDYITNSGRIYELKDLTPATKYYMRAYAKTKSGEVAYGDVIKFYTIPQGNITWNFHNKGDAATEARITNAVNEAISYFNSMTSVVKTFDITYSAGTPTADCNYTSQPWMNVGPNTSYQRCGTIMHEMQHGLGLIPYSTQWYYSVLREKVDGSGRGTGHWLGDRVSEALRFWDNNTTEQLNGDYQHMWPYGINGAHEDNGQPSLYLANAMLCQALGEDGLEHTSNHFADPYYSLDQEDTIKYYLKNENEDRGFYTSFLVVNESGSLEWKEIAADEIANHDEAAWYVTFTPENQFYQFRNVSTGRYLSLSGQTTGTVTSLSGNTDFHLMKARVDAIDTKTDNPNPRGYWMLHHAARNPRGLAAGANGVVNTEVLDLRNTATSQRWLILTAEQVDEFDKVGLSAFRARVTDILDQLKELRSVPHTENTDGTDASLDETIAEIEAAAANAKTAVEVANLVEKARQAEFDFLSNATPSNMDQPFNVSLLLTDAGMDAADGWVGVPTLNYSCGEFYETNFNMYQIIENLPAGTYQLKAQGFQRPGRPEVAYSAWERGSSRVTAYLYLGNKSVRLANICSEARTRKLGIGDESAVGEEGSLVYIPNDMQSAANYFKRGLYENEIAAELATSGGELKVGVRCNTKNEYYWACFDNFRLYYYGTIPADDVLGIETTPEVQTNSADAPIYDLSGRRVNADNLGKGIYIQNGRKFIKK